jgi:hypothetical protein
MTDGLVDSTFGTNGFVNFFDDMEYGYLTNLLVNSNNVFAYGYANAPIQMAAIELVDLGEMQFSNLPIATEIKQMVWPNPSRQQFTLKLSSNSNELIELRVFDIFGKQVYSTRGPVNKQYLFGSSFTRGIYMAEIRKGGNRLMVKLIKQ